MRAAPVVFLDLVPIRCISGVVAIIGGGIGGIATAVALQRRGINAVVFERDVDFSIRRQGYGLTLQQGGSALRELGIEIHREAPSSSHFSFTKDGEIVGFFGRAFLNSTDPKQKNGSVDASSHNTVATSKFNKRGNIHLPRQKLRALLMDKLQPHTVRWDHKFEFFRAHPRGVELHFTGRPPELVACMVGADGLNSVVRRQLLAQVGGHYPTCVKDFMKFSQTDDLNYLGVVVVLGIVDKGVGHPLLDERIVETMDGCTRLYCMPFDASRVMWQLSFPLSFTDAQLLCVSPLALKAEALRRCGQWHAPIPALLEGTDPGLVAGWPVCDREPLAPSALSRARENHAQSVNVTCPVTLLGDAAHPMSPFKGQGANQALLDAVLFAKCLTESPSSSISSSSINRNSKSSHVRGNLAQTNKSMKLMNPTNPLESADTADARYGCPHDQLLSTASDPNSLCNDSLQNHQLLSRLVCYEDEMLRKGAVKVPCLFVCLFWSL
jgi:salicylate hydroxylase